MGILVFLKKLQKLPAGCRWRGLIAGKDIIDILLEIRYFLKYPDFKVPVLKTFQDFKTILKIFLKIYTPQSSKK